MTYRDTKLVQELENGLQEFEEDRRDLPGINEVECRKVLLAQLEESYRRVKYVAVIEGRPVSADSADPANEIFDPLKAAVYHKRQGNLDEAFWCVFLAIHFGKHGRGGWELVRQLYGRMGQEMRWDWKSTSGDPADFRRWLDENEEELKQRAKPAAFGNHRKRESLNAYAVRGTGSAVHTYVDWVSSYGSHLSLVEAAVAEAEGDPEIAFDVLYEWMDAVATFGRLAKFDFLAMVGTRKLDLAPITAGSPYLGGATGALDGARLLFGGRRDANLSPSELNDLFGELDDYLDVGMQVLEDAVCNWQKSPRDFIAFRG